MRIGRFAPSPTGPLHFGSLLTAVASYLEAKTAQGLWRVRIEDVDIPRQVAGAADIILTQLEGFGFGWDGQVCYQSERSDLYQYALEQLMAQQQAYYCSCSRREIRAISASGIYPGLCRNGALHPDKQKTVRVLTDNRLLQFQDAVQGSFQQQLESEVGDFVICRADGIFAYQLAVVVDDAEQGITQVVRGCDLLDSTPRQLYLQQLLSLPKVNYAHLPLATHSNGDKLSKQTGARAIQVEVAGSFLKAALDFLGQAPPSDLHRWHISEIWQWAIASWQLNLVPAALGVAVSSAVNHYTTYNDLAPAAYRTRIDMDKTGTAITSDTTRF